MPRTTKHVLLIALLVLSLGLALRGAISQVASGTWAPAASMAQARSGASAALLQSGAILITGGDGASGPLADAELFDTNGIFSAAAPMNVARSKHISVVLQDGRVLVAGGTTGGGGTTNAAEVYEPLTNSWTSVAGGMVEARSGHTASLLADGRVLIAAGANGSVVSSTLEIFDPNTNAFSFAGVLSSPRKEHAAALLADGRVLIVGGSNGATPIASADLYNPSTGSVSPAANLSAPRAGHSATTLLHGTVLVAGGNNGSVDLVSAEIYDANASTVSPVASALSTPRQGHLAFLLPHNNNVLIVGGTSAGTALASAELFTPWQGTFSPTGSLAAPRSSATGSALSQQDGLLLVAGGKDASGTALPSTELHGFATVKTDKADYAPSEIVTITGSGWQPGETVTMVLHEANGPCPDRTIIATANAFGNIFDNSFSPDVHDVGVRFYLTATGGGSGLGAQTTFTDAELVTSEVTGATNDVTVVQGGASVPSTINLTATGNISSLITSSNPSTAKVNTVFTFTNGTLTSGTPSSALNFFAGTTGCTGGGTPNCDVAWTGAPTPYGVTANFSANAGTSANNYSIALSVAAATTQVTNPSVAGGKLADATATTINVHVRLAAPSGLTATGVSQTQINLTWADNSTGESNFVVERSNDGSSFASIATLAANSISYNDTSLSCSLTRYYRVKAPKTAPTGLDSDYSNIASATTTSCDTTAPTTTIALNPPAPNGSNGWYKTDVGASVSATDNAGGSGVTETRCVLDPAIPPASFDAIPAGCAYLSPGANVTTEGQHVVYAASKDNAGNKETPKSASFKMDKTAPFNVAGAPNRAADHNNWYNHAVDVAFSGQDATSGIASCSTVNYSGPDTATASVNGTCTDNAGNTSTPVASSSFKFDATPPTAALSVTVGTLGTNGWYTSDVTVHTSGTDSVSSPVSCTADQFQTTETAGTVFNGSCTNDAGLTTDAAPLTVKLDKTPPTATFVAVGTLGNNGWYTSSVTIQTSGNDTISNPVSCTADQFQNTDTTGTVFHGSCTNDAGLTGDATPLTVKRDATPPYGMAGAPNRAADHNGWYNHAVDVVFSGQDATSGIASCSTVNYSGPDTATASVNGTCTDNAGNTSASMASSVFKFDATPPTAALSVTVGTLGTNGWYTSDVTVHTSGTDTVSNPTTCTADQFQTTETVGNVFNGSCTNDAGLTTNATPLTIKLDKTGPTAALTPSGTLGNNGWYVSNVTIHASGTDTISSPVTCTGDQFQTTDTLSATFNGSCTNDAGLTTNATSLTIKRDATPPVISINSPTNNGSYILNQAVASSYSCTDGTSGVATCAGPVANGSNFSTNPVAGHSFTVNATDQAGNPANATNNYNIIYSTAPCLGDLGHMVLQPINWQGDSVFKMGSTVPTKFRVCDANGVSVGPTVATPNVVSSYRIQGIMNTTLADVDEAVDSTTPDTTFRWSSTDQLWIFNTKTGPNTTLKYKNATYWLQITLADGAVIGTILSGPFSGMPGHQFGLK